MKKFPYLGFGLGLRTPHYEDILETAPDVNWFEILSEDYLVAGGNLLHYLEQIRENYPIVMHGVSLSIGSSDPVDQTYLVHLKELASRVEPQWISDHLCWTGVNGVNTHDLLPLPYTEEALQHVVNKVKQVQDFLGRQILLENVSSYVTFKNSTMPEWEFYTEVIKQADCYMLLDINNIYVSAFNHEFDPRTYIDYIPHDRVIQFHMAGHSHLNTHIVDTHDHDIIKEVWDLYAYALRRFGKVSTMIERDDHIPPLKDLLAELQQAREIATTILIEEKSTA